MRTALIAIWAALIAAGCVARAEPAAPAAPPFDLPTLDGSGGRARLADGDLPALVNGVDPDLDALHAQVIGCYPSRSLFRVELSAVGGVRTDGGISADDNGSVSDLGRVYFGLVAKMPLYSDAELDRERERELRWRQDAADRLARWSKALYDYGTAARALSLYTALERFRQAGVEVLPVVERDGRTFVGVLQRAAMLKAMRQHVASRSAAALREHAAFSALAHDVELDDLLAMVSPRGEEQLVRMRVPDEVLGQSLRQTDFRHRYGVQVIAIETPTGELLAPPDPQRPLGNADILIVMQSRTPTPHEGTAQAQN